MEHISHNVGSKKETTLKNEKCMWNVCMNINKEHKLIWDHRIMNVH